MRQVFSWVAVLTAAMLSFAGSAGAAERIGAFQTVDGVSDTIILVGAIDAATLGDLGRALLARPDTKIIILDSAGGVVPAALKLAIDVRRRGLSTAIPKGFACLSACSYVFFAGHEHVVLGQLGVHQISSSRPDDASGIAIQMAAVRKQLARFDADDGVYARMAMTPAAKMHVFSRKEIAALAINQSTGSGSRTAEVAAQ